MRTLIQNLQDLDPGYIKIISELWGVDLPDGEIRETREALAQLMLDPGTLEEVLETLPTEAQGCMDYFTDHNGYRPQWSGAICRSLAPLWFYSRNGIG
jgi:hypothetical protein